MLVKSIDIIVLHRICIISLKLHFISSHSIIESFVSRRRRGGYIIQVLLELITESSLSLSPEPPAEQQSGDQQRKVRAVVRVCRLAGLWRPLPRDNKRQTKESITNIAHEGKGKLDQNQQKQPVCSKTLGLSLAGG